MNIADFDSFLFFPGQHWNHTWERQHELVTRFAEMLEGINIQIASPTGLVNHNPFSLSFLKRIINYSKAQAHSDQNPIKDNMQMLNLKYIPFHNDIIGKLNYHLIKKQVSFSANTFFWSTYMNPTVYEFFKRAKFRVYDLAERRSRNEKLSDEIKTLERKAISEADVVFVDNMATIADYQNLNDRIYYVPQGVNTSSFFEKECGERKYIGYIGNLHFAIDYEFLKRLIELNDKLEFLIIGGIMEDAAYSILKHPNVVHVDNLPKEKLNDYLAKMRIGLIPYIVNDVTVGVYPTKLFEYLAAGVPVVSTPLPEVAQYANPNYLSIISQPINLSDIHFNRNNMNEVVRENTWDKRWTKYLKIISQCLESI